MNRLREQQLLQRVKQGDSQAFAALVEVYRPKIESAIKRYVKERHAIKDVTQETLLRAFEGIPSFNGESQFYTWLYRIAINTAKNYALQNNKRRLEIDIDSKACEYWLSQQSLQHDEMNPELIAEELELATAIAQAIKQMPAMLRKTLLLKEERDLSHDQIAKIMGCPAGTVRSRLYRAREVVVEHALDILLHHQPGPLAAALARKQRLREQARGCRKPRRGKNKH